MSRLSVTGLRKSHQHHPVLRGVDLAVPEGAVVALLGSSGCGKTTLLRLVAGFDQADAGEIMIGDRVVESAAQRIPPEQRRIGYVPQEGALFPHLTVAENVAFGLKRRDRAGGRVAELLALTGLTGLDRRYPHQLSGGQQQRTALARALAAQPALVLLDEPFNALDMDLRRTVCHDVIATLRASGATVVLVTHDPQEALASADLVAVMRDGVIAQLGDPVTVYRTPADPGVARLTGQAIFLDAALDAAAARTELGEVRLRAAAPSGRGVVMLRPEQLTLTLGDGVPASVVDSSFCGDHVHVTVALDGIEVPLKLMGVVPPAKGEVVRLRVDGAGVAFAGR